ncbi:hypothetical protein GALMADRAFT_205392 [Galerina marginata CBS 339.88]|uniref:Uncharacterized protein n=1 Tax=Galerina marginata (strain CBS 339.88) TaxID=685588 RepID=A0A067TM34_GALM3|nr:hypothetical protein GALMADRAFT_205392 [Galerina marginata CBS 339.88]
MPLGNLTLLAHTQRSFEVMLDLSYWGIWVIVRKNPCVCGYDKYQNGNEPASGMASKSGQNANTGKAFTLGDEISLTMDNLKTLCSFQTCRLRKLAPTLEYIAKITRAFYRHKLDLKVETASHIEVMHQCLFKVNLDASFNVFASQARRLSLF